MKAFQWKTILIVGLGLLSWSGTAATAEAATLVLISLECVEPEDRTRDEPELVIFTGGRSRSIRFTSLGRGEIAPRGGGIIARIPMNGRTSVTLYDRDNGRTDWFDSDDYLGSTPSRRPPPTGETGH